MSSESAISVRHLGKCYQIYEKPHQRLLQMLLGRFGKTYFREFWAIRDLSFMIPKGKVMGIMGKNGAGKSTLLQIICGTLAPTHGEVEVNGRVAALLELGSGFNPEFTGIENIYLNGQILGLSREQVDERLDDILGFADIGDFVHQPVKTYSSGMFARLAFSVAVSVDPDILIVDEALSVGDAWFQHKSMARMRKLMESGCTVLFVSHSIDAVRALCDDVIWLEHGAIRMLGSVTDVTNAYLNDVFVEHNRLVVEAGLVDRDQPVSDLDAPVTAPGEPGRPGSRPEALTDEIPAQPSGDTVLSIRAKEIRNASGQVVTHLGQGESFTLEFELQAGRPLKNVSVGFLIKDGFGQELTGESYFNSRRHGLSLAAGEVVRFVFRSSMQLRGGQSYAIALRVNQVSKWDRSDNIVLFADELAMVFDVISDPENPMWFKFRMPFVVEGP